MPKIGESMKTESSLVIARDWRRARNVCLMGPEFSSGVMKMFRARCR